MPRLTLNLDPSDLSLKSSEGYRCEPLEPGSKVFNVFVVKKVSKKNAHRYTDSQKDT
jgi:hypothetical protein